MLMLLIETTCDETAVALAEVMEHVGDSWPEFRTLSSKVVSQVELHRVFGGIVPEVASRRHQETLLPLLDLAFEEAGVKERTPELVGVSLFPGLIGAVLVGVAAAKSLSVAWDVPFIGTDHLLGHIYSVFLSSPPSFPFIGLVISGGHTNMYLFEDHFRFSILGRTLDDAVGEAFDKAARLMGLGYPGGPIIDRLASRGEPIYELPVAMKGKEELNFSYSGLKTALIRLLNKLGFQGKHDPRIGDVAASFQVAALEQVIDKIRTAVKLTGVRRVVVGGGVAANSYLRRRLKELEANMGLEVRVSPKALCGDNALMLAPVVYAQYKTVGPTPIFIDAFPSEEMGLRAILGVRRG